MQRKLVQIGKSLAVTIPSEVIQQFGLTKGQAVEVTVHPVTGAVVIRPGNLEYEGGQVTTRFQAAAEQMRLKYDQAFKELAK